MTPTEKGRRFDALYHGEFIRQLLCEMIVNREADLEDARAENARLRKEIEQWHRLTANIELPEYPLTEFQPKDLERENAKLRELLQKTWDAFHDATAREFVTVKNELRELGVEVEG